MKKILFIAALIFGGIVTASAQQEYRSDYKYNFFSNWSLGASGVYTKTLDFDNWQLGQEANIGCDVRLTKRLSDGWRLRLVSEINGFMTADENMFDRYGKAMGGFSLNFLKNVYVFADGGLCVNPSFNEIYGLAGDAGLGLNFDFGRHSTIFMEVGADRVNNVTPDTWTTNLFGKAGYMFNFGPVKRDRERIQQMILDDEEFIAMSVENEALKDQVAECEGRYQDAVNQMNELKTANEDCQKHLIECHENLQKIQSQIGNNNNLNQRVYFETNSYKVYPEEMNMVSELAEIIKANPEKIWFVKGYCDMSGESEYNQTLSVNRANSVIRQLVKLGVPEASLKAVGMGQTSEFGEDNYNRVVILSQGN